MAIATPLSVSGRWIIGADGRRVKLAGVNWAGAHEDAMTPAGLNLRHRDDIARQIAAWGFNSVRFPFALETVAWKSPVASAGVAANPDLEGSTPWQVYAACVKALTGAGVMVIPNCHLLSPGWCCAQDDANGLWWNQKWPASAFTSTWQTVAAALADDPLVIGYDLKNEPRKATVNGKTYSPSWGDGDSRTDFRRMYSDTATSILEADPRALFFCEGLSFAGNLTGAPSKPVTPSAPSRVVYSLHDYSWFHPSGLSEGDYAKAMKKASGSLLADKKAPVWIGEFGDTNNGNLGGWLGNFLTWARKTDADWCWWQLDGTNVQGTNPETGKRVMTLGQPASYGLFNPEWTGPSNQALLKALQAIQAPTAGPKVKARRRWLWFGRRTKR